MKKILIIILACAFFIRLSGLMYAWPYGEPFGDEIVHVISGFKILETKNPISDFKESYLPPLLMYLEIPIFILVGAAGLISNAFSSLADFREFVVLNKDWFLWVGRLISAAFGAATVYVVYNFAKKLFSEKIGLLSAFLLAFDFLHVHDSQIGHIWAPLTFFIVMGAYGCYEIYLTGQKKWYWLAALMTGLGYAMGQLPIFLVFWIFGAHYFRVKKERFQGRRPKFWDKNLIHALGLTAAIFVVSSILNFYSLFKHSLEIVGVFLKIFGYEQLVPSVSTVVAKASLAESWQIAGQTLFFNNPFLLVFGALGLFLIFRKTRGFKRFLLVSLPICLFLIMVMLYSITYRYVLPTVPFLAVADSYLIFWIYENRLGGKRKIYLFLLILIVSGYSLAATFLYSAKLFQPDTLGQGISWIYQNAPSGSRVVSNMYLNSSQEGIYFLEKYNKLNWVDARRKILLSLSPEKYPKPNYFLIDLNLTDVPNLPEEERWADYVFVFFYGNSDLKPQLEALDSLKGSKKMVASFYPAGERIALNNLLNFNPPNLVPKSLAEVDSLGPNVEIYRIIK